MEFIEIIVQISENVEREYHKEASHRKLQLALDIIKVITINKWGYDFHYKYKNLVPSIIKLLCKISKREITLNLNNQRYCLLPCL